MTLRVAQFFLKIAHLSFSMGPRGPRAYGLRPRLWLLIHPRNFGCDVSVRPPARTDSGGGGGESQDDPTRGGGVENAIFSWREMAQCFWGLLGNRRLSWRETA